jgi:hypothetical protein
MSTSDPALVDINAAIADVDGTEMVLTAINIVDILLVTLLSPYTRVVILH